MSEQKSNIEVQFANEQYGKRLAEKHAYELQSVNSVVVEYVALYLFFKILIGICLHLDLLFYVI